MEQHIHFQKFFQQDLDQQDKKIFYEKKCGIQNNELNGFQSDPDKHVNLFSNQNGMS